MMKRITWKRKAVVAVLFSMFSVLWAEEPWEGVWKLNTSKSLPYDNPPKNQVFTTRMEDGMIVSIEDITGANGVAYQVTAKLAFDGKDYPVNGSRAGIALVSGKRLGPNSAELRMKKQDGTVLATYWIGVSADRATRFNLVWYGPEVSGPPARVQVYDRQ